MDQSAVIRTESGFAREYPSWDALVADNSTGYVAVVTMRRGAKEFTRVFGPFPTKREALRACAGERAWFKKHPVEKTKLVRAAAEPLWKPDRYR